MKVDDKRFNVVPCPCDFIYYRCKIDTNLLRNAFYLLINALRCFGHSCWPFSGRS